MSSFSKSPLAFQSDEIHLHDEFRFDCGSCGNCCRGRTNEIPDTDIFISGPDLMRIAAYQKMSIQQLIDKNINISICFDSTLNLNVCRLKIRLDGSCSLFRKGRCTVYPARPRTCALFPISRGYSFLVDSRKNKAVFQKEQYIKMHPSPGYQCGSSSIYTVKKWLELNDVPEDDVEEKQWNGELAVLSEQAKRLRGPDQIFQHQAFQRLYLHWGI